MEKSPGTSPGDLLSQASISNKLKMQMLTAFGLNFCWVSVAGGLRPGASIDLNVLLPLVGYPCTKIYPRFSSPS